MWQNTWVVGDAYDARLSECSYQAVTVMAFLGGDARDMMHDTHDLYESNLIF